MGGPPTIRAALLAAVALLALMLAPTAGAAPVASATIAELVGQRFPADAINAGDASPTGHHVLFRVRGSHLAAGLSTPTNDIYVMRADGSHLVQLTDSTQSTSGQPLAFALGSWWPDSTTVWITRFDAAQRGGSGVMSLRTLAPAGDDDTWPETTVNAAGGLQRSQLTADGRYLVWSTQFPGSTPFTTYYAMDTATRRQATILGYGGNASFAPGGVAPGCPASLSQSASDAFGTGAFEAVVAALTGPGAACDLDQPTTAPAPSPAVTPAPIAPLTEAGTSGPSLRLASVVKSLEQARRRGLALRYDADGATKLQAWMLLKKRSGGAKAGTTLARTSIARPGSASAVLRLTLTGAGRRALEGRSRVGVVVRLVATDAVGGRTVVERDVILRD